MAVVPLSTGMLYHFNVIYNHAKSPLSQTEDTRLSLSLTRWIVECLENTGLVNSYYHDRDRRPDVSLPEELDRVLTQSEITLLVLTPGFLKNCFYQYTHITAFLKLLDETPQRLIVLKFGQADDRIPAVLWGQKVITYEEDNGNLDTVFWCRLYRRIASTMSLTIADSPKKQISSVNPSKNYNRFEEQLGDPETGDAVNSPFYSCSKNSTVKISTSPTLYFEYNNVDVPLDFTRSESLCHVSELNDVNRNYGLDSTLELSLSGSTNLDSDAQRQDSLSMGLEYLDEGIQTHSSRSQDSDSNLNDSNWSEITKLPFYDPLVDGFDGDNQNQNVKPWHSLGLNDVFGNEELPDPKSTRQKYQKKYEKLLYMDETSSIPSETDSSEQDEATIANDMSKNFCSMAFQSQLQDDLNEIIPENVDNRSNSLNKRMNVMKTDVGIALLKELDAVDPEYGWQDHKGSRLDRIHNDTAGSMSHNETNIMQTLPSSYLPPNDYFMHAEINETSERPSDDNEDWKEQRDNDISVIMGDNCLSDKDPRLHWGDKNRHVKSFHLQESGANRPDVHVISLRQNCCDDWYHQKSIQREQPEEGTFLSSHENYDEQNKNSIAPSYCFSPNEPETETIQNQDQASSLLSPHYNAEDLLQRYMEHKGIGQKPITKILMINSEQVISQKETATYSHDSNSIRKSDKAPWNPMELREKHTVTGEDVTRDFYTDLDNKDPFSTVKYQSECNGQKTATHTTNKENFLKFEIMPAKNGRENNINTRSSVIFQIVSDLADQQTSELNKCSVSLNKQHNSMEDDAISNNESLDLSQHHEEPAEEYLKSGTARTTASENMFYCGSYSLWPRKNSLSDRFHVMENRLNTLSHDINTAAEDIDLELDIIHDNDPCNRKPPTSDEQRAPQSKSDKDQ